jgi:subtilisin family serine protease
MADKLEELSTVLAVLPSRRGSIDTLSLLSEDDTTAVVQRVSSYFVHEPISGSELFAAELKAPLMNSVEPAKVPEAGPLAIGPRHFPRLGLIVGDVDPAGLNRIRNDPGVLDVVAGVAPRMVYDVDLLEESNAQRSWSIDFLNIPKLWEKGLTGKGIAIGHLDSGVDGNHVALKRALKAFALVDTTGAATERETASDNHGHGTHTAGILCAQPVDGVTVGIAPEATLFSGQVNGDGALRRLLGGLEWLLGKGVRLISLSAGVEPFNPVFRTVVDRLRGAGVLPIVAIGNSSAGTSFSPANYRNALGIGSINDQSRVADSSCSEAFGEPPPYSKPDLVAPGAGILSTRRFGGYEIRGGTSQATPCVAGIAALLMQAFPTASIGEIEQRIVETCRKLDGVAANRQGRGLIDPVAAFTRV